MLVHPKYITDTKGNKISVILSVKEFENMIEKLEDLEDIRLYDDSKKKNEPSIPFDEAFLKIEAKRNKKMEI